jgi:hypothetical protein
MKICRWPRQIFVDKTKKQKTKTKLKEKKL